MTRALVLSLLLAASVAFAREKVRPKPTVSPVRQGQQQPPPAPPPEPSAADSAKDDPDNPAPPDDQAPDDSAKDDKDDLDSDEPPSTSGTGTTKHAKSKEDDDRDAAVGFAFLCCCFLVFAAVVGLIIWLVRRKPSTPPPNVYPPGQTGNTAGPFHLSVAAIALDARTRGMVDSRFNTLGGVGNPGVPATKAAIARALAQALLEQKDHWRWFGYGEKPLMYAFGEADISFRAATDDFRARANTAAANPDGELVVYTLVCCANRLLKGVTRLDSIAEAQEVFLERSRVQDHEVFGGEVISSPLSGGMSEAELTQRYPEMNRLVSAVG